MADALRLMEGAARAMATAARSRDVVRFRDHRNAYTTARAQLEGYEAAAALASEADLDQLEREIASAAAVLGADHEKSCACALCFGVR